MSTGRLPIRLAAQMTGVSADRLRIWERRYQAVRPQRGPKGREYAHRDIQRILLLREALACGHSIGQVSRISDRQLRSLIGESSASSNSRVVHVPEAGEQQLLAPLLDSINAFAYVRAERELTRIAVLLGETPRLVHQVVLPLLRIIGNCWERGAITVAQEHMVSTLLSNLLGRLLHTHSSGSYAARVLFATPREERHFLGVLAASVLAASGGLEAICLGGDLPPEEIVTAARKTRSDVVVLAVYESWPATRHGDIEYISKHLPKTTELWIGGPICLELKRSLSLKTSLPVPDFHSLEKHLHARAEA
jgi:MerR family transcriptional regulator, light-induced transcriptional regulator